MQVFQVLRCYKCEVFQVHVVKKSNKWTCKMCGEKQSMKRHYGIGNAKECRGHVQKLNNMRGDAEQVKSMLSTDDDTDDEEVSVPIGYKPKSKHKRSKWNDFIEETENQSLENYDLEYEMVFDKRKRPSKKCLGKYMSTQNSDVEPMEEINNECTEQKKDYNTIDILNAINELQSSGNNVNHKEHPKSINQSSKWSTFVDEDIYNNDSQDFESNEQNDVSSPPHGSSKWNTFIDEEENDCNKKFSSEKENNNEHNASKTSSLHRSKWNAFIDDTSNMTKSSQQNKPESLSQITLKFNDNPTHQFINKEEISTNKKLEVKKNNKLPMFEDEDFNFDTEIDTL